MSTAVIAIGGNAIVQSNQKGTVEEQQKNIRCCCEMVADLVEEGYDIVLTHGNGPQVGSIVMQNDMAKAVVPENPLDVCGAQSQGSLGYMISQTLSNVLKERNINKKIASVLTQVVVDEKDPAFENPTKFIGPFFTQQEAKQLQQEKGFCMKEDSGRGWRRVVPSPMPLELVEEDAIRTLSRDGFLIITVGGGGIPVVREGEKLKGIEAVIDKDFASALVAEKVNADYLIILTGVEKVAINYGKTDMKNLSQMTLEECRTYQREGQFPPGSMGPKIAAAVQFVEKSGGEAIVTSIEAMEEALKGNTGTRIFDPEMSVYRKKRLKDLDLKKIKHRIKADLEAMKAFTATPGNGCTRMPFTKETRLAAEYLKKVMADAGLEVREDCVGNVFGVLPGEDRTLPCIMMGSHYDSVYNGGDYDGIAGVICAIETARVFNEEGTQLKCDFVVAAFMDEEGCRFGTGYFGSKCMLGQMTVEECKEYTDKDDITVYDAMKEYGLAPKELKAAAWAAGSIGYFIEPHIEQGPVLDSEKTELGLVDCIVGIQRYMVTVNGRADHAGTTPMHMRKDAVSIASKVISEIDRMAIEEGEDTVATVGYIRTVPGAMNIIADSVEFSIDIRSRNNDIINRIAAQIRKRLEEETTAVGAQYSMDSKLTITPVCLDEQMLSIMEESCKAHGYSYRRLPSGAGHDALAIGQVLPTVMLFVPSKDGRSHCPVEYTSYGDFAKAVQVLHDLLKQIS